MTDDDFDKIDDEDFASEFDFVDEEQGNPNQEAPAKAAKTTSPSSGGGGQPASPMVKIILGVVTVLGLGFFGYTNFVGTEEKPTAAATPDQANPLAAGSAQPTPLPTPLPTDQQAANTEPQAPANPNDIDFEQAFGQAQNAAQPVDKLATAVPPTPTTKSFEQVQRELQTKSAQQSIAASEQVSKTLDSLSTEMTINVNQIKQLETMINTLATNVEQLNRTVSAMDNRILSLTEIADALAQDLNNVKKVMIAEDLDLTNPSSLKYSGKKPTTPISSSAPSYSVHAIIPGRAWLKSTGGQIITITEGDKLGDYGTVAVIDANNGIVRTSSGITFK